MSFSLISPYLFSLSSISLHFFHSLPSLPLSLSLSLSISLSLSFPLLSRSSLSSLAFASFPSSLPLQSLFSISLSSSLTLSFVFLQHIYFNTHRFMSTLTFTNQPFSSEIVLTLLYTLSISETLCSAL